jgi:hypothetical protein
MKSDNYASHIIKLVLAVVLVGIVLKLFIKPQDIDLIRQIDIIQFIMITFIGLVINSISGLQYYYILKKQVAIKLNVADVITLPVSMGLWGLVLPFQGALIYLSTFLKFKYDTKVSESIALTLFSYLVAIVTSGIIGLYYTAFILNRVVSIFSLIAFAGIVSPFFLLLGNKLLGLISFNKETVISNIADFITNIVKQLASLVSDKKTVFVILLLNIVHTSITVFWYYFIAQTLHLPIPFLASLLLTMVLKLSIVLKLTPGNIGIDELISGGLFSSLGVDPSWGVIITLTARASVIVLMLTAGVGASIYNSKYFHVKDLLKTKT